MSPTDRTLNLTTPSTPFEDEFEEFQYTTHTDPVMGLIDDDYDNYGFDDLGNTTDRNFGQ